MITYLKTLSVNGVDTLISQLSPMQNFAEHLLFLEALTEELKARRHFELVSAWSNRYFKVHQETLLQETELFAPELTAFANAHTAAWSQVQNLLRQSIGMLDFLRPVRTNN